MKNLFIALALFVFTLPGCSGGTIPAVVCDYGQVVCNISETLCREIPGVPPQICDYITLACYNLEVLCQEPPESIKYKEALMSLEFINGKLNEWKYAKGEK